MGYPMEIRAANKQSKRPAKVSKAKQNGWSQEPPPFDPEDLTRRLYAVLAQQKAYAEKKRRLRVEAERRASKTIPNSAEAHGSVSSAATASSSDQQQSAKHSIVRGSAPKDSNTKDSADSTASYRHIPQNAASQFTLTTTQRPHEGPLIHKLSKPAMKFHMEGVNASRPVSELPPDAAPSEKAKMLRKAQSLRLQQYERNQFQHTHTLQPTVEEDKVLAPSNRHTFDAQLRPKWVDDVEVAESRRQSTGTMLSSRFSLVPDTNADMHSTERQEGWGDYELAAKADEHRVDWTQSDETVPRTAAAPAAPRKQESRWNLRARINGSHKSSKHDEKPSDTATGDVEKHKTGFFSRFRHQHSP
ncbi:hypothetical protein B0I35DRAFT_477563 [Stachybotrys elegans]|uniref:Uncharacterized protein n=1 Tax=Stachybotrys elegans TaxID=80388 RepID=A0A8K0WSP1_9HYPO|nr:hypothetical protein B0I35DRAFT_477563 [Stachybotrys elegans]